MESEKAVERTEGSAVVPETGSSTQTDLKKSQTTETNPGNGQKSNGKSKSKTHKKSAKAEKVVSSDEDSSDVSSDDEDSTDTLSDSSSDESDDSKADRKKKKKAQRKLKEKKAAQKKAKEKAKAKLKKKQKEAHSTSESESDADSSDCSEESGAEDAADDATAAYQAALISQFLAAGQGAAGGGAATQLSRGRTRFPASAAAKAKTKKARKPKGSKLEYKRVDELWDSTIHNFKLTDTAEDIETSEYDQYLFNIRRTFDWEGKYKATVLDLKSKYLKEALKEIMEGVKGISLVEETPNIDPNLLFLYLEDLRALMKEFKSKLKNGEKMKKKAKKHNQTKVKHIKVLLKYLDEDYALTKKTLYPMLESGLITFDLLWALFKPNTLGFSLTYDTPDEPRAFKIELAEKDYSFMKGEWYNIEGRYFEYDGKSWGMGTMSIDIPSFKGARKITSLACYPLKYHKDEAKTRKQLIERGKKFVSLQGVNYRSHFGLAYYKKKRQVVKVNINGRIMVDPAIHRRILPNYNVSTVKPKDADDLESNEGSDSSSDCCCGGSDSEDCPSAENLDEEKTKKKYVLNDKEQVVLVEVPIDENGQEVVPEQLEIIATDEKTGKSGATDDTKAVPVFSDEEYLIASPLVLGFAFSEKLWLEFTVSGVKDIVWNSGAYESLVLEDNTKDIVRALVESHKYHPAESIDDVIQGKGKGLVAVLHGPPGTGKTLTAEGISELLQCPLYMVSAGELGTDPRTLESELQKILDIAHAWGAVLLLDEADVFLEKRTIHDIHRNALVSIFLRLLEYFQGILFLTTNRVETFDDAFQSRIHIALRYGELTHKAKKSVFKMFIERVRVMEGVAVMPFKEDDFNDLAKKDLNGRQIKNVVRTAQALAVNKGVALSMEHIRKVLDVLLSFDRDLKGGTGYEDAMRSYT